MRDSERSLADGQFSCVIMGSGSLLIQCAEILLQRDHQVTGIISKAPPIVAWADKRGIPVPGGHLSVYEEPFVWDLAEILQNCIEESAFLKRA